MDLLNQISNNLKAVKEKSPLIHHITNYVTVNDCANMTLAIGASPVMADDIEEVEEMVGFSGALVINIGTLNERTIRSMITAGKKANEHGIPVILDPVGIGATKLRTNTVKRLLENIKFTVIRGNMSEIKLLGGIDTIIKGVDSTASAEGGEEIAATLSKSLSCTIAITGAVDIVTDGIRICHITNGDKLLSSITGTGCMCTSLIGSYLGAGKDSFISAIGGIMTMGLAGELALKSLKENEGIGTFKTRLFDEVFLMNSDKLVNGGRVTYGYVEQAKG
jgi:hydroxyethylthiazole kinase